MFQVNKTPTDRVSMHLWVAIGSLMETDQEQGMAHFLEHMQFDGSTHFKPEELVKYFQRIGMQFGPDANAHTGYTETVYDILLPRGDNDSLAEAMWSWMNMRKALCCFLIRSRKKKKWSWRKNAHAIQPASGLCKRRSTLKCQGHCHRIVSPLESAKTINNFDQTMLRRFYDTWYRPENMVLVIVGQFDPAKAQELAEKQFAHLKARRPEVPEPDLGTFEHRGVRAFFYPEKETGTATVRIETLEQKAQPRDSKEQQGLILLEDLANQIVNNRLDRILQEPDSPFTNADIGNGYFLQKFKYSAVEAECDANRWTETLQRVEKVLRQALNYGFTSSELKQAKKEYKANWTKPGRPKPPETAL